ncbi:MAG: hypothetical protein OXH36_04600 [Bdellovibrionales bacterium]|nr:hypothetical protein [Bdellovibrionales bacterium]
MVYFPFCCAFLHGIYKEATHKIGAKLVKKAELIENLKVGLARWVGFLEAKDGGFLSSCGFFIFL